MHPPASWSPTPRPSLASCGGLARDPAAGLFKTWYGCKCAAFGLCYATSRDGRTFDRPKLRPTGVPNCVLFPPAPGVERSDGGEVVLDLEEPDPSRRYKMAEKPYCSAAGPCAFCRDPDQQAAGGLGAAAGAMNLGWRLLASADGVSGWRVLVNKTGLTGDAGTVFKNPFRNRWVFSIKAVADQGSPTPENGHLGTLDRWRMYHDSADLFGPAADDRWGPAEPVPWLCADALDQPWLGSTKLHTAGPYPGLYVFGAAACESLAPLPLRCLLTNAAAVAVRADESLLVGFFDIFRCKGIGLTHGAQRCPHTLDGANVSAHGEFASASGDMLSRFDKIALSSDDF